MIEEHEVIVVVDGRVYAYNRQNETVVAERSIGVADTDPAWRHVLDYVKKHRMVLVDRKTLPD